MNDFYESDNDKIYLNGNDQLPDIMKSNKALYQDRNILDKQRLQGAPQRSSIDQNNLPSILDNLENMKKKLLLQKSAVESISK